MIHDELRRLLANHGIRIIRASKKYWRPLDAESVRRLAAASDALISGVCTTAPSTTWGALDSVAFERLGKPAVTLVAAFYEALFVETAAAEGIPGLKRVVLPFPIEGLPDDVVRRAGREAFDAVAAALVVA